MEVIEDKKLIILDYGFISIGRSKDGSVIGFAVKDKYCWTNIFGFEIL